MRRLETFLVSLESSRHLGGVFHGDWTNIVKIIEYQSFMNSKIDLNYFLYLPKQIKMPQNRLKHMK